MGCKESKQDGGVSDGPKAGGSSGGGMVNLDLSGLDAPTKFEYLLPFSKTKIEVFEQKVKGVSGESKIITLEQLRKAFADDKNWSDALLKDDGLFVQTLQHELFKPDSDENQTEESSQDQSTPTNNVALSQINRDVLILWGLILCGGDIKVKAKVFYDVLQDNNQEFISANDKDFPGSFNALIDLACKLPYQQEPLITNQAAKKSKEELDKIDELKESMQEGYLDAIYGVKSKLTRPEWEAAVAKNENWIFTSKKIRQQVEKVSKKN